MEYYQEVDCKNTTKIRKLLNELPEFVRDFFRGIGEKTSTRTRLSYAIDLRLFFNYLVQENKKFKGKEITSFLMSDLKKVTASDIDDYLEYLTFYIKVDENGNKKEYHNYEKGKSKKLSTIRSMFSYFYKRHKIKFNPSELVNIPKIHSKKIIRLEDDEVEKLLNEIDMGTLENNKKNKISEFIRKRDLAIVTLLLGTGIRVSECVGINMKDLDFNLNGVKVRRKGGDEAVIYFGDEVLKALKEYIEERGKLTRVSKAEEALFLSIQRKRICERAIQNLVKKYSQLVTKNKNISPHKLRSTYGTALYKKTRDIYIVANVLGHKDINTTSKHYADIDDARRREVGNIVKLRNN